MELNDVIEIIKGLSDAGVTVWVDGGWCVDALVGRALREHNDLDIAINRQDEKALQDWLTRQGYTDRPSPDKSAWNYVVGNDKGCLIDIHVFEFDGEGKHIYGVAYPRESLTGHAMLGGIKINCIPPDWMFRFKTGYAPAEKDIIDIQALAQKYGYEIPNTHQNEGIVITYVTGSVDLLDGIEEMWSEGLRQHHIEKSVHFKELFKEYTFVERKQKILKHTDGGKLLVIIALYNDEKTGYCVSSCNELIGEIDSLYVSANYRNRGIARELTEKSLNWLIENGCQSIELDVAVGNEEVLPFYEKFRFYPQLYKLVRKT